MSLTVRDRVLGCLQGIATGDAIGKQSEMLSSEVIRRWHPQGIRGFEGRTGSVMPRYVGNSKREWRFGETTDDTERTIAVAQAIVSEQRVSHEGVGRALLRCSKSVHPGVKSLWEFHEAGDPARIAGHHDGCGAAIRSAPVGVLYAPSCLDALVDGAREASISTHGGALAIAAAAANAAAVSAAIEGAQAPEILELAVRAAQTAERRFFGRIESQMGAAIRAAHDDLASAPSHAEPEAAARRFPSSPLTIVPLALALATTRHSAREAILLAANIGGDSDSVASIAGGILGARCPGTIDKEWVGIVESVNGHGLAEIAEKLLGLRRACG